MMGVNSFDDFIKQAIHRGTIKDDTDDSKEFLLQFIMRKYLISTEDLKDIGNVKSKLRDSNIEEILSNE